MHSRRKEYEIALAHYEEALKLQQASLPSDHPDIARTLHNLARLHDLQGNTDLANDCLQRANDAIGRNLSEQHPLRSLIAEFVPGNGNAITEDEVITMRF